MQERIVDADQPARTKEAAVASRSFNILKKYIADHPRALRKKSQNTKTTIADFLISEPS
jgi:hypothetical protein